MPIIPQKFNNCGPTNLTLVLNYFDIEVDQFDVAAVVRPNYEDRNVSPDELAEFVRNEIRLEAGVFVGGDIDIVRRLVASGYPVIIETGLIPDETTGWMGHYLTVFGYDDITRRLIVRDTYLGPWQSDGMIDYDDVRREWEPFNNLFIVVYPPHQALEIRSILGEAFSRHEAVWHRAAEHARTAVASDDQNPYAWFNLGSSLIALARDSGDSADIVLAAAAFDQARHLGLPPRMLWYQFSPYEAYLATGRARDVIELTDFILGNQGGRNVEETYYYRGLALQAIGDDQGARVAFNKAVQLNPGSQTAQLAQQALGSNN